MRLAIISDVHGNLIALEAVLAGIMARAPDAVVNLGDCVTSPLWPRETFELLESLAIPTVRGNHDRWISEPRDFSPSEQYTFDALRPAQRAWLGALPASLELGHDILAVHGTPVSDTEYLLEDRVDGRLALAPRASLAARVGATTATLILCGHSHHQHMAATSTQVIVNPGSVGMPRNADNAEPDRVECGSPHARFAMATRVGKKWRVEMIALEYDWSLVEARAKANGREDVGQWFR